MQHNNITVHANDQCPVTLHANDQCPVTLHAYDQCPVTLHANDQCPVTLHANDQCPVTLHANDQCPVTLHANDQCPVVLHANGQCLVRKQFQIQLLSTWVCHGLGLIRNASWICTWRAMTSGGYRLSLSWLRPVHTASVPGRGFWYLNCNNTTPTDWAITAPLHYTPLPPPPSHSHTILHSSTALHPVTFPHHSVVWHAPVHTPDKTGNEFGTPPQLNQIVFKSVCICCFDFCWAEKRCQQGEPGPELRETDPEQGKSDPFGDDSGSMLDSDYGMFPAETGTFGRWLSSKNLQGLCKLFAFILLLLLSFYCICIFLSRAGVLPAWTEAGWHRRGNPYQWGAGKQPGKLRYVPKLKQVPTTRCATLIRWFHCGVTY